jgi:hypothetical protein
MVGLLLAVLLVVDIAIVPPSVWWEGIRGLLTPAVPPEGITATTLGALADSPPSRPASTGTRWPTIGTTDM